MSVLFKLAIRYLIFMVMWS